jgi:hypothetical protein
MSSTTLYPSATAHINHHPYTAMIPPYIQIIPRVIETGIFFAPLYEAFDDKVPQRAKLTIAKMVEFVSSKTTFTIIDDYDVLAILHQIDAYVEEVYPLRADERVKTYLDKILLLRQRIYTVFRRVLNRHPQWKQAYIGEEDIFTIMRQLYRPFGIELGIPATLLEELALCPTIRANPTPSHGNRSDKTNPPSSADMGSLYHD